MILASTHGDRSFYSATKYAKDGPHRALYIVESTTCSAAMRYDSCSLSLKLIPDVTEIYRLAPQGPWVPFRALLVREQWYLQSVRTRRPLY